MKQDNEKQRREREFKKKIEKNEKWIHTFGGKYNNQMPRLKSAGLIPATVADIMKLKIGSHYGNHTNFWELHTFLTSDGFCP